MATSICSIEGCTQPVRYKRAGLCRNHWQNAHRHGLLPGKPCQVEGCGRNVVARGYCTRHYEQWSIHGDPLVRLKKANGEGALQQGYMTYKNPVDSGPTRIREHVRIMEEHLGRELDPDELVHHINGNKLDNRIENMRLVSRAEHAALHQSGESNVNAKLNPDKVREIRRKYAAGEASQHELAAEYHVAQSAIHHLIHRHTWKHVS